MNSRRSFFKSLALLGAAAAGCPGLFIPKLEPVRWKVLPGQDFTGFLKSESKRFDEMIMRERDFAGSWRWFGPLLIVDAPTVYAVKPPQQQTLDVIFHLRDS